MRIAFGGVFAVLIVAIVLVGLALRHEINREPLALEEIPAPSQRVAEPPRPETDNARALQQIREDELKAKELQSSDPRPQEAPAQTPTQSATKSSRPEPTPRPVGADTQTLVSIKTCEGSNMKVNSAEKRMFTLHNKARTQRNLRPLCVSPELTRAARAHSQDMLSRDYFEHNTPEGITPENRTSALGSHPADDRSYDVGNENIALGSGHVGSPENRFTGFMNSPGHRAGILNADYSEVGIGAVSGGYQGTEGTVTYTVNFGGWS